MLRSNAMTIGQLSRRTGVPIKILRTREDLGLLYTLGRSESYYRLFVIVVANRQPIGLYPAPGGMV